MTALPDARNPGDPHYSAYVGPPAQYDLMGATQFRLLCSLGLRAHHRLLDVGCGSLRAGRFFISYLDQGHYCGVEPNEWLLKDAITHVTGRDLIDLKAPRFAHVDDFSVPFDGRFDFIMAQSIFSHTEQALLARALRNYARALAGDGLLVATLVEGPHDAEGDGWIYPDCVTFRRQTIRRLAREAGLCCVRLPWFHPRQTWYLFSPDAARLPTPDQRRLLKGVVLGVPEFRASWARLPRYWATVKHWVGARLSDGQKRAVRRLFPGL